MLIKVGKWFFIQYYVLLLSYMLPYLLKSIKTTFSPLNLLLKFLKQQNLLLLDRKIPNNTCLHWNNINQVHFYYKKIFISFLDSFTANTSAELYLIFNPLIALWIS